MTIDHIERRLRDRAPGLLGVTDHCAVLVPLVEWAGDLYLLFEVRAKSLRRQPGETCFPGGRMEPGESATECAFRETREELGIPASAIRPLARMDAVYHQGGFLMHPVLAQVDAGAVLNLSANPDEVAETFLVPLRFFEITPPEVYTYPLQPQVGADFPYDRIGFPDGYAWKAGTAEVPIWTYKGRPIWGITARIVRGLLEALRRSDPPGGQF